MAMSANAVLMKFFKLPPAVRMLLALAGFGSLAMILFRLLPGLRTRQGQMWVLIIGGIGLVLFLIFWGLRRMFFKKKSSQLSEALDSQGPTRGDIAEQEQIYRQKFRAKMVDLKTNGLSVYKLPWFVLIGEPGCGKTASLIHSGLDFPLGKDEVPGFGGTRNYNWWFANEAVILDTAGRIAFQEEGTTDKVEWEYFLKLLKAHRPRCPVNGLIIALPADKLLRDNSEERAGKAAVLRERLRQVHQTLGVRFPTFVLVTKMDLVGGFSEFFEEIRVDLQQRNQMFGWSRPGEFQEPYDPKDFPGAFEQVYRRIRDWSMRYLQRKATEDELGMIVTFPESFRQLRDPLHDYIATIFQKSPLLEPPFFRGFYFTSAVQEGAPIFDVFSRTRAGIAIAERPTRAVDSKAFFIHDFYANKVFPENGLVFRSARHVSLNQRMRRVVWIGTAAMFVLMVTLFGFGLSGTRGLIDAPLDTCETASQAIKGQANYEAVVPTNLKTAKSLQQHYEAYSAPWTRLYARLLFVGANIRVPQERVGEIHARFVLDCIFKPILDEVEARLANDDIPPITEPQKRARYLEALRVYTKWYGEVVGQHRMTELDGQEAAQRRSEFEALLDFLDLSAGDHADAAEQFKLALDTLAAGSRSFAREILRDGLGFDARVATETIVAAVRRIAGSWMERAQLSADNTDSRVQYWMDFVNRVADLRDRYAEVLALKESFARDELYEQNVDRFEKLTEGVEYLDSSDFIAAEPGTLYEAFLNFKTFLLQNAPPETEAHRIIRFGELFDVFASYWNTEFDMLREALEQGAPDHQRGLVSQVYQALEQGRADLESAFKQSLAEIRSRLELPPDTEPVEYYVNLNLIDLDEANPPPPRRESARIVLDQNVLGMNQSVKTYLLELRNIIGGTVVGPEVLENLANWPRLLEELTTATPASKTLRLWFDEVERSNVRDGAARADVVRQKSGLKQHLFWRPVELFDLATQMWSARRANSADLLLAQMAKTAGATTREERLRGLARLIPDFNQPSSLPFEKNRFNTAQAAPVAPEPPQEAEEEQPGQDELGRLRRSRRRAAAERGQELGVRLGREKTSPVLLYKYHTREFLIKTLQQFELVQAVLRDYAGGDKVLTPLTDAANEYIDEYFNDWYDIYSDPTRLLDERTLEFLEQCRDGKLSWPDYVETVESAENDFATALANRMAALIREVVMFDDVDLDEETVAEAIFTRIKGRLKALADEGRSIPHIDRAMRSDFNLPDLNQPKPELVYSSQLVTAWDNYVREVRELGPLIDADSRASAQPPDLEQLADTIVYKRATTTRFPLIAPLMDIAAYGQQLLVHHLDQKLADLFARHRDEYPLIRPNDARDPSALLTRISERKTIDPQAFLDFLRAAADFNTRYGELFTAVKPGSAAHQTLDRCQAWTLFLYDDSRDGLLLGKPRPLDVWLVIVPDPSDSVQNPGNVYAKLVITLPLLSNNAAAKEIDVETKAGEGIQAGTVREAIGNRSPEYRWNLVVSDGVSFGRMTAVAFDKHAGALAGYPERAEGWSLPGNPWSLLMAMGARPDNDLDDGYWKIPVRMETGVRQPIGFLIGLKIGSRDRPFPGVIPPHESPGPRPKMDQAAAYLARSP